jgi:hypothetical protein
MTSWRLVAFALAVAALCALVLPRSGAQAQDVTRLEVTREDARTFKIARPDAPAVRVTFLSTTAFHVHVLTDDETARPIDYMRVKSDASYPPVPVQVESSLEAVRFSTAAVELRLAADNRVLSLNARAGAANLIENWKIDPDARTAQLDLRAAEHIYGFGDKRAALDHRDAQS